MSAMREACPVACYKGPLLHMGEEPATIIQKLEII